MKSIIRAKCRGNTVQKLMDADNLFKLAELQPEASTLNDSAKQHRMQQIQQAYNPDALAKLRTELDKFSQGDRALTALNFYLEFEKCSPLVLFHTFPRKGIRNLNNNGIQQSYGDHVRLLLLGFDMFDQSDIDWLMTRLWGSPADTTPSDLEDIVDAYHKLSLDPTTKAAIWIIAALHDYGKIFRRGFGLDAEDAEPLCKGLLAELADPALHDFIQFGIRHHDLIEYVITGETPCHFISEPASMLEGQLKKASMPMLALIQFIGAASLGEGRITKEKREIYHACMNGEITKDHSTSARLGRLLFGTQVLPSQTHKLQAENCLRDLNELDRLVLTSMLEIAVLHDWTDVRTSVLAQSKYEPEAVSTMLDSLIGAAKMWKDSYADHTHVVFENPDAAINGFKQEEIAPLSTRLLNGSQALIIL